MQKKYSTNASWYTCQQRSSVTYMVRTYTKYNTVIYPDWFQALSTNILQQTLCLRKTIPVKFHM
jgi:hypothetical protein